MSEELFDSLFNIYARVELMCVPDSLMHKHQEKKNNFDGSVFIDQPLTPTLSMLGIYSS